MYSSGNKYVIYRYIYIYIYIYIDIYNCVCSYVCMYVLCMYYERMYNGNFTKTYRFDRNLIRKAKNIMCVLTIKGQFKIEFT